MVSRFLSSDASSRHGPHPSFYSAVRNAPSPALNALATIMVLVSLLAVVLAYVVFRAMTRGEDQGIGRQATRNGRGVSS